ncbi:MAG TPA: PDZ domain-containing protein, partial [Methylomirabilota bacterium]|nr:PDZ domain-containing protein [Methylomirabilota bacterium]
PANLARSVMENLIHEGRVVRGYLGVNIQNVTPALARQFSLSATAGALVTDVSPGSPADKAGLQPGDVILEFNGKPVRDSRHLKLQAGQSRPGTRVPVQIVREGRPRKLEVTLAEFAGEETGPSREKAPAGAGERLKGVGVADLAAEDRRQLQLPTYIRGALVTAVEQDSAAYAAGLRVGDIILEINRKPVSGADEVVAMTRRMETKEILLRIWSQGGTRYLVVNDSGAG